MTLQGVRAFGLTLPLWRPPRCDRLLSTTYLLFNDMLNGILLFSSMLKPKKLNISEVIYRKVEY
jgi:hypothetical protein